MNNLIESTEKKKKKASRIGMAIGVAVFICFYWLGQQFFFKPPSFDKQLIQMANELNRNTPIQVDEYTCLNNAVVLPGNALQYNYTLINMTKDEINPDTVKKYIESYAINYAKTSPDMKVFREHKVTLVYNYNDKNGNFAYQFSITPEIYITP